MGLSELEKEYEAQVSYEERQVDEDDELQSLYESMQDHEPAIVGGNGVIDSEPGSYDARLFEISRRSYEFDEKERAVADILDEIERDYFFKKAFKKLRGLKGLVRKGLKVAGKVPGVQGLPGFKAVTQLARGNMKGVLGALAKDALNTWAPGSGALAAPILGAVGLKEGGPAVQREFWRRYAEVAKESFSNLAENMTDDIDDMQVASRLAAESFQSALAGVSDSKATAVASRRSLKARRGDVLVIEIE